MGLFNAGRDVRTINALLTGAEHEARRGGDALPGPEHLLLSALNLADGTAALALGRFGVDGAAVHAALERVHAEALSDIGVSEPDPVAEAGADEPLGRASGVFRSTPQAQQVFRDAVALSKQASPSRLLGAHVVAAVCAVEHGTSARVLAALGIDRDELRSAALTQAAGDGSRR